MQFTRNIIIFLIFLALSVNASAQDDLRKRANTIFGIMPSSMYGSKNDTIDQIKLGERLYFETALSINSKQSCNSCHNILGGGAGVDNLKTSVGTLGAVGRRNTPSTWNAGFQLALNWDASAKTLEEQAKRPLLNPLEMALPSEKVAIKRLSKAGYKNAFRQAFPDTPKPLTFDNIARALAAFQRTLITDDRFNHFLAGDDDALNTQEKKGLKIVLQNGCSTCHTGPLMGGQFTMKMGLINPYSNTQDKGLAETTGRSEHNFLFKVPMLRNVANTAPFFHDGGGADLDQAVFDTGWLQLGVKLSNQDVKDISAFLRSLGNIKPYKSSLNQENVNE